MIHIEFDLDDLEYLLSVLDECPQDSREYSIREEMLRQTYEWKWLSLPIGLNIPRKNKSGSLNRNNLDPARHLGGFYLTN